MYEEKLFEDEDEIEENEILEVPKEIRRLNIETHDYRIKDIVGMIKEEDIILRPHYQRGFIWDKTKSSLLIESVLLNIPLPPIYLAEENDGTLTVIDGLQRLHTFLDYYNDKFSLRKMEGVGLSELNGLTYFGLIKSFPKAKRILDRGNIRTITIKQDSDPDIKYDIFERLNSGSVKLNNQEIRNCIFHGKLNDLIMGTYNSEKQIYKTDGLRHNKVLQRAMNLSGGHPRYLDAEVVIRILAMIIYSEDLSKRYKNSMKLLINDFMEEYRVADDNSLEEIKNLFNETVDKIYSIFENKTFKRFNGENIEKTFNRSIMDCLVVTFQNYTKDDLMVKKEDIVNLMDKMLNDTQDRFIGENTKTSFIDTVTKSTSSKNVLKDRLMLWQKNFDKLMKS